MLFYYLIKQPVYYVHRSKRCWRQHGPQESMSMKLWICRVIIWHGHPQNMKTTWNIYQQSLLQGRQFAHAHQIQQHAQ